MEIKISKSARHCHASGKPFTHGEEIVSLIRFRENEFAREDYSSDMYSPDFGQGALAVWSCRYSDPKEEENRPPEEFSPLRGIFYSSVEHSDRNELAIAYLAAQLLRRQKAFRLIKESDNPDGDAKVLLFVDRINGKFVEVRDPDLSYAELSRARETLLQRLQSLEETNDDRTPQ